MGSALENPMGVDWFGMTMGLGFVLSFGYWCTDFLVVQRAMAANSMSAARRTPLIAAVPKMLFPALVILPGMIAIALDHSSSGGHFLPHDAQDGTPDYNMTIPDDAGAISSRPACSGSGFTALMASFMSGMAGNVTAFNTVWTYDIYQSYIARSKSDQHYLWMGRCATVFGILSASAAPTWRRSFNNIMDMLQLVFGFVNAPLFATFLLGMFWKRTHRPRARSSGLLGGTLAAALFHGLTLPQGNPRWHQGRLARRRSAYLPQRHGARTSGWPSVALTVCFVLTHRHLPGHQADQDRRGTQGPGLFAHAQAQRRGDGLVSATGGAGHACAARDS